MNRVFEKQLGRNIEVYVDDILGKSWEVSCFIVDLEETFATLRRYDIKINPAKCIFGKKSVLIREEGSDQKHVYYCSHSLRGPEIQYSEVEKIALALIILLTNSPLGRIMTHSEVSGRMIKWTLELGEYDIQYRPRTSIKAQALSDFLSEMIQPDEDEYEDVLVGIRAAWEIGASRIILYSDSQLVTQQIKCVYEAKDDRMFKYLKLISQAESFVGWSIEQIPRGENGEADALAKMAASLSEVNTREVLHVTQLILSTDE
ncbi:uncharacterized protein [Primulina eburnea]|uniref:uncharacterized protein n=1 Tax=Primulina eburnea TaxID=1245227 RepID=UPI003C6C300D